MKRNILLILTASYGGGVERGVLDYVRRYNREKFNPIVVTLREGNIESEFKKTCKKNKVEYMCINQKFRFSLITVLKLVKIIKKYNIKLIHARLIESEMYAFILKLLFPKLIYICSKHNTNEFRKSSIFSIFDRIINLNADKIIPVSKSIKEFLIKNENLPRDKMEVIYNGIKINDFKIKIDENKKRKKLGLSKESFVIGIVGRLEPQKNHKTLLNAIKILKDKIPKSHLLIIGTGSIKGELQEKVRKEKLKDYVSFLGYRKDVNEIYQVMDVLCTPSLFEGFGRVNAEALLANTPVISGEVDGVKEVIRDEIDGFLVNPRNTNEIVEKILWIYNNPNKANKMTKKGKERIKRKFSFNENIRKIEKEYLKNRK